MEEALKWLKRALDVAVEAQCSYGVRNSLLLSYAELRRAIGEQKAQMGVQVSDADLVAWPLPGRGVS
jgi:hypothetical protein